MTDVPSSHSPDPSIRIELGRGRISDWEWELIYCPNVRHGPVVLFGSTESHVGQNLSDHLDGPFGKVGLGVDPDYAQSSLWAYGEIQAGFDKVLIECDDGITIEAHIVDCEQRFGFNFYVAVTPGEPVKVTASSFGGDNAERSWFG